jgi:hypothetical protein
MDLVDAPGVVLIGGDSHPYQQLNVLFEHVHLFFVMVKERDGEVL